MHHHERWLRRHRVPDRPPHRAGDQRFPERGAGQAVELGATGFALDAAAGPFELVIETAGTAGAVERALGLARRGGRVVLIGRAGNDAEAYQVLRDSYGPRGKVMLDIDAP